MEYKVLINIGEVSQGIFSSAEPEFNSSILPYAMMSCFSESRDYKVSRSSFSCIFETDMSKSMAAKSLADKIKELIPNFSLSVSVVERDGNVHCSIGKGSSFVISNADYEVMVDDDSQSAEESEETQSTYDQSELVSLCRSVDTFIAWNSFKKHFDEVTKMAPKMNETGNLDSFKSQCYLLSVNDGCGTTFAINHLTLLGHYCGAYSSSRYYEYVLSTETVGRKISIRDLIPYFKDADNEGLLMCIDISAFTNKTTQAELKDLLIEIAEHVHHMNYVFRVPYLEPKELKRIEDFISDILLLKTFVVPPYTDDQLKEFAEKMLSRRSFELENSAWELFHARIREEKMDGCFYGFRTVKKVVDEMILMKLNADSRDENSNQVDNADLAVISKADIESLANLANAKDSDPYAELYDMIGMEKIAERVKEIVAQVKISIANTQLDKPCMHMRFVGAPGTGKTTVARIIGKIFAENGILTNGHFFEYSGRDLCGRYVGQTAPKTLSICRDAYGSVLFLDEAYELYTSENNENDYGHEALATLIAEMENHRDNFVVIMAGYKGPMETLMKGNVGLRSRMPFVIEFPSYNREQLVAIFMSMVNKHFKSEPDLERVVKAYFDTLSDSYLNSEEFSNARFVRNLYERTWSKAAMRTQMEGATDVEIRKCDFETASQEKEFREKLTTTRNRVGF
ncbi:MAG: AAA family ATPase [Paludibacteraceae bacterium]|nr:AAA family ATPase [Paludibacteraceae bacterium]